MQYICVCVCVESSFEILAIDNAEVEVLCVEAVTAAGSVVFNEFSLVGRFLTDRQLKLPSHAQHSVHPVEAGARDSYLKTWSETVSVSIFPSN